MIIQEPNQSNQPRTAINEIRIDNHTTVSLDLVKSDDVDALHMRIECSYTFFEEVSPHLVVLHDTVNLKLEDAIAMRHLFRCRGVGLQGVSMCACSSLTPSPDQTISVNGAHFFLYLIHV